MGIFDYTTNDEVEEGGPEKAFLVTRSHADTLELDFHLMNSLI